jgi:hypothetical protein
MSEVDDRRGVADRIRCGDLPRTLEEWPVAWKERACAPSLPVDWSGWCRMWWNVAHVREQAFERDADAEAAAEDWR